MWICTTFGFFSIVADRERHGHVQVRARQFTHLKAYRRRFYNKDKEGPEIISTPHADYRWRISIPHKVFLLHLRAFGEQTLRVNNFKAACHDARPDDRLYHEFLVGCWQEGVDMQENAVQAGHLRAGGRHTLFGHDDDVDLETGREGVVL